MMFVLFPVAAIFAFYLRWRAFRPGDPQLYPIFSEEVVLLALAGIVIRLFSVAPAACGNGRRGPGRPAAVLVMPRGAGLPAEQHQLCRPFGRQPGTAIGDRGGGGGGALPSPESRVRRR